MRLDGSLHNSTVTECHVAGSGVTMVRSSGSIADLRDCFSVVVQQSYSVQVLLWYSSLTMSQCYCGTAVLHCCSVMEVQQLQLYKGGVRAHEPPPVEATSSPNHPPGKLAPGADCSWIHVSIKDLRRRHEEAREAGTQGVPAWTYGYTFGMLVWLGCAVHGIRRRETWTVPFHATPLHSVGNQRLLVQGMIQCAE